jgi:hypothetical protein
MSNILCHGHESQMKLSVARLRHSKHAMASLNRKPLLCKAGKQIVTQQRKNCGGAVFSAINVEAVQREPINVVIRYLSPQLLQRSSQMGS